MQDTLQQIRDNLAKVRLLDKQMEQMKQDEVKRKYDTANQIVDVENLELSLLLDELEQQQSISQRLQSENQALKLKLQNQKITHQKMKLETDVFVREQEELLAQRRKEFEAKQSEEDSNATKEDNRLKSSLQLIQDKKTKLIEEKRVLQEKLDHLKSTITPKPKRKKLAKLGK